ncbi:hypothetical protein F4680DRAFT_411795 [Xylaria scruposa]|nr:hypothetical protein F4680DRAFT_411795 [Xylaria scruposa]
MASRGNATIDYDNVVNNAFSNFAPLLALFGDEVTKQFLAGSIYFPDVILLGVAPIGIIAIMTSAIRVSGNRLLKSFIGRARDSPDDEEKEILTSTSVNVREIWNGTRVVRQTGKSKTTAIVFSGHGEDFGVHRLSDDLRRELRTRRFRADRKKTWEMPFSTKDSSSADALDAEPHYDEELPLRGPRETGISDKVPPNLTLNMLGTIPSQSTALVLTIIGLLVQTVVIIINGLIVYHWQLLRGRYRVAPWGYPTWLAGTVAMGLGSSMCGFVVQSSCCQVVVRPTKHDAKQMRIIYFQSAIAETETPPYAIEHIGPRGNNILLSWRIFPLASNTEHILTSAQRATKDWIRSLLTVVGVFLCFGGLIAQNFGTRELHWSAAVIQLGATVVVTLLRSWLRQGLGTSPKVSNMITPLEPEHAAAHLASELMRFEFFLPILCCKADVASGGLDNKDGLRSTFFYHLPLPSTPLPKIITQKLDEMHQTPTDKTILAQAQLADIDDAPDLTATIAANCYEAMEDISVVTLGHMSYSEDFLHALISKHANEPTKSSASLSSSGYDTVTVGMHGFSRQEDISYLQAIIGLTRYACEPALTAQNRMDKRDLAKKQKLSIYRVVGRCSFSHLDSYRELLRAWLGPPQIYYNLIKEVKQEGSRYTRAQPGDSLIFGLPLRRSEAVDYSLLEPIRQPDTAEADIELLIYDDDVGDISRDITRNIVLDIITSFLLDLVIKNANNKREYHKRDAAGTLKAWERHAKNGKVEPRDLGDFMVSESRPGDLGRGCQKLADILTSHGVCSPKEALLAVVPVLISQGLLFHWPKGHFYRSREGSWDETTVSLERPKPVWEVANPSSS